MSYILEYLADSIDSKLNLIDKTKNLLKYPYTNTLSANLIDMGDGSILTSNSTNVDNPRFLLTKCHLPIGKKYIISLDVTNIIDGTNIDLEAFKLEVVYNGNSTYSSDSSPVLDLSNLALDEKTVEVEVEVYLNTPKTFEANLLLKPQIELQPINEDGTPDSKPTVWVPNMSKTLGNYADNRFNSINAKLKILSELIGLPDCSEYPNGSTLVVKDGKWTIGTASGNVASNGLIYILNDDEESYSVTGIGTCADIDVVIPAKHKGWPVTGVGQEAFLNCNSLTSVDIPDSVTYIAAHAFKGCTSLTSVDIPYDASLRTNAFEGCTSLTFAIINKNDSGGVYNGCTALTNIIFINTERIPNRYFQGCTSLTSVDIPSSVTTISYSAFENCTSLTSITIPDSVTQIREDAFNNTGYYNNSSNWDTGVLYIGNHLIRANDLYTDTCTIKAGTKTIAHNAFKGCQYTTINIPSSVKHIASDAFSDCKNLRTIRCAFAEGAVVGSSWGATGADVWFNSSLE